MNLFKSMTPNQDLNSPALQVCFMNVEEKELRIFSARFPSFKEMGLTSPSTTPDNPNFYYDGKAGLVTRLVFDANQVDFKLGDQAAPF